MENAAAGGTGRPKATETSNSHETNEAMTSMKKNDQSTRHSETRNTTRITRTTHTHEEDSNQSKTKDHEQNPHPAWNQDSRGRRADGSGR